jgi:hypothetical protein
MKADAPEMIYRHAPKMWWTRKVAALRMLGPWRTPRELLSYLLPRPKIIVNITFGRRAGQGHLVYRSKRHDMIFASYQES